MLYREIIAVCSEIRTKQINTPCDQNVGFLKGGGDHGVLKAVLYDSYKRYVPQHRLNQMFLKRLLFGPFKMACSITYIK